MVTAQRGASRPSRVQEREVPHLRREARFKGSEALLLEPTFVDSYYISRYCKYQHNM